MTRIFRCNLPVGEEAEHVGIEVHDRAEGVILKQGVGAVKGASGIGCVRCGLLSCGPMLPHVRSWRLSIGRSTSSADLSAASSSSGCCAGHERAGGLPGGRGLRFGVRSAAGKGSEPRRVCRRPFGLSYAAMAGSSSMASAGGMFPMGSRRRRWLNQATHSRVANSTASKLLHGPCR